MESIRRSIMMLKPDSSVHMEQKNQAILKLQSTRSGLEIDLSAPFLMSNGYFLYLFDKNSSDYAAGEIASGRLQTTLPAMPIDFISGAAVVDKKTLSFVLKSMGLEWKEIAARFKFKYAAPKTEQRPPASHQVTEQNEPQFSDENQNNERQIPEPPDEPRICDTCPHVIRQDKINPFPSVFPNSEWVKISYPGPTGWWHYISGKIRSGDTVIAKALGVPGEYGMAPPIWLEGFGTYMRCATPDAGGYWLMFQNAETGEVLDMGLSPHDA